MARILVRAFGDTLAGALTTEQLTGLASPPKQRLPGVQEAKGSMNRNVLNVLAVISMALLAGCKTNAAGSVYGTTATNGVAHTEPVHFNGQRYTITFQYQSSLSGYDVTVRRPKRPLRNTQGDRSSAVEVATSSVSHFACPKGQRAQMVPGSATFAAPTAWSIKARCA